MMPRQDHKPGMIFTFRKTSNLGLGKILNIHLTIISWADEDLEKVHQIIHEDNIQLTTFVTF